MVGLTIRWDEKRKHHVPPSLETREKVETLIGRTFENLEEITNEINCWGWRRMNPNEWPGYHHYHWHHPTNCDSIFLPDKLNVSRENFPYLKRWPIQYLNLNYGAFYDLAQIELEQTFKNLKNFTS